MITDPTDRLNRAAAKLRELAGAATPGPWHAFRYIVAEGPEEGDSRGDVCSTWPHGESNAAYIAAMSPPLALAIATWLETEAWRAARDQERMERWSDLRYKADPDALAVADVVLGESFQQAARDIADIKQDGEPEPVADMTFRAVPKSTKRYRLTPEPVPDCEAHGLPTPCVWCNS